MFWAIGETCYYINSNSNKIDVRGVCYILLIRYSNTDEIGSNLKNHYDLISKIEEL